MNAFVIGCGRWGTFIGWYLNKIGYKVTIYGRPSSKNLEELKRSRKNEYLTLPNDVELTSDLANLEMSDIVIVSVDTQSFRNVANTIKEMAKGKTIALCMKGIEISTGMRLSSIAKEILKDSKIAVWLGPGHVESFVKGIPNCMVIDSEDEDCKKRLVKEFSSPLIRFYYGTDLIGNEIGAASKNVIGIAGGMLDGLNLTSLKGALMARGTREISRLIVKMGGKEISAYGLCHLGDYEATLFSPYSHNRMFGEKFIKKEKYDSLAEGYYTVEALVKMEDKYGVELPICSAVYDILYRNEDPSKALEKLFLRNVVKEF